MQLAHQKCCARPITQRQGLPDTARHTWQIREEKNISVHLDGRSGRRSFPQAWESQNWEAHQGVCAAGPPTPRWPRRSSTRMPAAPIIAHRPFWSSAWRYLCARAPPVRRLAAPPMRSGRSFALHAAAERVARPPVRHAVRHLQQVCPRLPWQAGVQWHGRGVRGREPSAHHSSDVESSPSFSGSAQVTTESAGHGAVSRAHRRPAQPQYRGGQAGRTAPARGAPKPKSPGRSPVQPRCQEPQRTRGGARVGCYRAARQRWARSPVRYAGSS